MKSRTIAIGNHNIGGDNPCFIIAEIGSNHNQQFDVARRLIDHVVGAGVDAVKFQSFTFENWISKDFEAPSIPKGKDLQTLIKGAELSYEMYSRIADYCRCRDVVCFSSPSHTKDIDMLHKMGALAFKFGSVQVTDLPAIRHASELGRPVILSAGASNMSEVLRAVEIVRSTGNDQLALLHCTTLYPCKDFRLLNLNVLRSFQVMFDFPVGYSDHTIDPITIPVAAVAMGARIIEKHVTLDRTMKGPDHPFALEPPEVEAMVKAIRLTEQALGDSYRYMLPEESELARMGRRSLVAVRNIKAGELILEEDLTIKRPGFGIQPEYINIIIGRQARLDIEADRVITWDMV